MKYSALAVAFIIAGTTAQFLDVEQPRYLQETTASVNFTATLPCGGCVRGGNIFCSKNGLTPVCCQTATQCATQIADKTFTCTNGVGSQFNRLVKVCAKNQPNTCGKTNINLNSLGENQQINATNIPVGASCSYRVMSKCGFPAFDLNNTNLDVTVINQGEKGGATEVVEDLPDNATLSVEEVAIPRVDKNGKLRFTAGNPKAKDESCGKMRKMFVTITNIPPAPSNTSRLLQTAAPATFSLTFTSTDGSEALADAAPTSSAFTVMTNFVVLIASLVYFAF